MPKKQVLTKTAASTFEGESAEDESKEDERLRGFVSYASDDFPRSFLSRSSEWNGVTGGTTYTIEATSGKDAFSGGSSWAGSRVLSSRLGHCYRIAQAERQRVQANWKLHFSVCIEDIARAWDIIAFLFIKSGCLSSLEAQNPKSEMLAEEHPMKGREITVDIYRYTKRFRQGTHTFLEVATDGGTSESEYELSSLFEQTPRFWREWVAEVDQALSDAGVRSRGLAKGDMRFGGSRYCSLRNVAFVPLQVRLLNQLTSDEERKFHVKFLKPWLGRTYPPNVLGYNAKGHSDPFRSDSFLTLFDDVPDWAVATLALAIVATLNLSIAWLLEWTGWLKMGWL